MLLFSNLIEKPESSFYFIVAIVISLSEVFSNVYLARPPIVIVLFPEVI
jgi:hypothetical protein